MIAILQRVTSSSVTVEGEVIGSIGRGLNVLLGVLKEDSEEDIDRALAKIVNLRIFAQFTLGASIKKGRRPSFENAAEPSRAEALYGYFVAEAQKHVKVQCGRFGARMEVAIENDGPVTIIVDSAQL